jgi:hypothetical protein
MMMTMMMIMMMNDDDDDDDDDNDNDDFSDGAREIRDLREGSLFRVLWQYQSQADFSI